MRWERKHRICVLWACDKWVECRTLCCRICIYAIRIAWYISPSVVLICNASKIYTHLYVRMLLHACSSYTCESSLSLASSFESEFLCEWFIIFSVCFLFSVHAFSVWHSKIHYSLQWCSNDINKWVFVYLMFKWQRKS